MRSRKGSPRGRTHGMSQTRIYAVWEAMIQRCTNPKCKSFARYGGQGITVCKRWLEFENFYTDMGPRPEGMTLERKKNSVGYRPSNCIWATYAVQNRNLRTNRWITYAGETLCLADWNRRFGLKPNVLAGRLRNRSVADVFTSLLGRT